ncbi:hypothetical protein Tco_0277375 [Tanacetum coccineum]
MLLNVDQLQKQLDKDDFQEDGSMTAFWVINRQFQKFIDSKFTLDYDSQMSNKYFVEYTGIEVKHFGDTLLQHMGNVKKSVAERTRHQRQYDRMVNKRQMQTQESKVDAGKVLDADLVDTESIRTDSTVQDENSRPGNDTDADDADIIPIYDEEPMAEVQLTTECNIFAIRQQYTEQPEIINEGRVDHNKAKIKKEIDVLETINIELEHSVAKLRKENETLKKHNKDLYDSIKITRSNTIEQTTSLLANNADLKAQIQENVFAIAALKNDLRKLRGNNVDTKFAKTSVMGKPVLQSLRNQSVVRQPNAFKSERPQMSKERFSSQVDVNNNLSRPVTQHYLPKRRESVFAKPDHMIASSESRNSSKNMQRFSSNGMVYNHYLDEAKKKTQERDRNSKTIVMPSARFQSTADGSKPKPRSTNHSTRSLPVFKSSCVTITALPKADHSKSSSSFSDSKNFVCSTCHKCVFNANHDACITKLLKEVDSHAKIQSQKSRNNNKPIDQKSYTQTPGRQIFTRHRFSPNKTSAVYEKTSHRYDLRWKSMGRIFKSVVLSWEQRVRSSELGAASWCSELQCHSRFTNDEIAMTFDHNRSNIEPQCQMTFEHNGSSLAPQCQQKFLKQIDSHDVNDRVGKSIRSFVRRIFQWRKSSCFKSSAVTTADASDKRQQQQDFTSSTSTQVPITVTADRKTLIRKYIIVLLFIFDFKY